VVQCVKIQEFKRLVPLPGGNPNRLYLSIVKAGGFFAGHAHKKLGEDVCNNLVRVFSERSAQVVQNEGFERKVASAHLPLKCRYLPRGYSTQRPRSRTA